MGDFLAVSAFRTQDAEVLVQAIMTYCESHGVACKRREDATQWQEKTNVLLYAPENGWIRVLWPMYFNVHDFPLCQTLSSEKGLVVSTVHVYDGDFWEHLFLNNGAVLHKFSSWPDYFAETPEDAARAKAEWKGDPSALSAFLGIPADTLAAYLVHLPITPPPGQTSPPKKSVFSWLRRTNEPAVAASASKAYIDDEFDLDNFWVFTDFWRRLGIKYPDPPNRGIQQVLELDKRFGRKLPAS